MFPNRFFLALLPFILGIGLAAQPTRMTYTLSTDSARVAALDPGDLLLQQGILLTNQNSTTNVSFRLSFDQQQWVRFALGPLYSSIFSLHDQGGCYFEITTLHEGGVEIRKEYLLSRGGCYSVLWSEFEHCWIVNGNRCRMEE